MAGNTWGTILRLTTFGESHGAAIGGVLDGMPAGIALHPETIQRWMDRRRPGQSHLVSPRTETDTVELLSGVFEGLTTGAPIGFIIRNTNQRPADYDQLKNVYRPSHADYTWQQKYGVRDYRGGGRSSARETACRVAAGAMASALLQQMGITVKAWVQQVGDVAIAPDYAVLPDTDIDTNAVRCPDPEAAARMEALIEQVKGEHDSVGGCISCAVFGVPAGLGEPVFDKLHADLGKAMLSINAVKGVEIGSGFAAAAMRGSAHNDAFAPGTDGTTVTNHSGGIQGGISNGMPIRFRVAFKPVATIGIEQQTVDTEGQAVVLQASGRHDPCVVPRAVPIVEAMTALVLADHVLRARVSKL
jgi:chorismate synthase